MSTPDLTLTLPGVLWQTLWDNAHIKMDPVAEGDPDWELHRAVRRYLTQAVRAKVGTGFRYTGPCTIEDAEEILSYLESCAGALMSSDYADARADGRKILVGLQSSMRQAKRKCGVTFAVVPGGVSYIPEETA